MRGHRRAAGLPGGAGLQGRPHLQRRAGLCHQRIGAAVLASGRAPARAPRVFLLPPDGPSRRPAGEEPPADYPSSRPGSGVAEPAAGVPLELLGLPQPADLLRGGLPAGQRRANGPRGAGRARGGRRPAPPAADQAAADATAQQVAALAERVTELTDSSPKPRHGSPTSQPAPAAPSQPPAASQPRADSRPAAAARGQEPLRAPGDGTESVAASRLPTLTRALPMQRSARRPGPATTGPASPEVSDGT